MSAPSSAKTLDQWLSWLEQLHPSAIDLSLQRVHQVAQGLDLLQVPSATSLPYSAKFNSQINHCPVQVVTVAGTNGKGSCIYTLEQILLHKGHSVGAYTSPHFFHFNERIRINGQMVSDEKICEAFVAVEAVRKQVSLTYFEFGTLAALWLFKQQAVAYVLLEVGLGGRLDAVNIIDADIAVITSIDVDHRQWLGNDRDTISREKLGIARADCPLVIAETRLTPHLVRATTTHPCLLAGSDFYVESSDSKRCVLYWPSQTQGVCIPIPRLPVYSVLAALCVAHLLALELKVEMLKKLLPELSLQGRFDQQKVNGKSLIFDVAHNPAAAAELSKRLASIPIEGRTLAVVAIMADKDVPDILSRLKGQVDHWYFGDLSDNSRAASGSELANYLSSDNDSVSQFLSIEEAFSKALCVAAAHDRIVVFGSFFTVAALQLFVEKLRTESHLGVS